MSSLSLSEKVFILTSLLKDMCAKYGLLGWQFFLSFFLLFFTLPRIYF